MKNNYTCCPWAVPLFLLSCFLGLIQVQARTETKENRFQQLITGTVSDQQGLLLPGVNIIIKGSRQGAMTNLEGKYSINAAIGDTLSYSFIGYTTKILVVTNNFDGDVQLQQNADALSEVVINAGYYTTTERERTGNIAKVTAEEIELQPLVSPLQTLQGRMAGVEISPGNDLPGSAPTIRIRGQNSLRAEGNYPLYIIDGMPINSTPVDSYSNLDISGIDPLSTLNLSNIESIEVLKDADATAIYGSRGANGVVLITTKKGKSEKTEVQARIYSGFSQVPNRVDLLNTPQYLQIRKRAFENDGVEPTQSNAYDLLVWDQNRETDWQELFFGGTAPITDANLSISGGNSQTRYRLVGGYQDRGTVYPGDYSYKKTTVGLQLSHTSKDNRFSLQTSINYGSDRNELVGYINYQNAFSIPPNAPEVFTENGELNWDGWGISGRNNPLEGFFNHSSIQTDNLVGNLNLTYQIVKGLKIKANAGYTQFHNDELVKRPMASLNPAIAPYLGNRSVHRNGNRNSWIVEPQLTYGLEIGKGKLEALAGLTFQENNNRSLELNGIGYVSESLIGNLEAAEQVLALGHRDINYKYNAGFARLAYQWKDKFFINLTGRRDGSSRFGPDKRFANFGAIGSAYIFTEENFFKQELAFLSFGKIRASYGTTGNDQIGDYGYLDSYIATPGPSGLYPSQLANPNYSWEVNKKLEAGIQLGFFKDQINLGLNWYRNRSSNQLVGYNLPALTGFTTVQANLPATVENKGIEFDITSLNINHDNFYWRTSFNISFPRNQLLEYPDIASSTYANTYRVGEPLNIALLYNYEGIDPGTGLYSFTDYNDDGSYDYQDRQVVQNLNKDFYGGINNSFRYKSLSLQFLFQFAKQEGSLARFFAGELANQRNDVINALDENSGYQMITQQNRTTYNYALNSRLAYTDASFIRLKTLSLGYQLPQNIIQQVSLKECKLFLHAQNLFTLTSYKGMDPELPTGGTAFGALRTITAGIEFKF
tara:strand:+ start:82 stop:3066 length:2985 start_codon:yes stop_codon:yes gene_type:complete